ncbi:MAG TPA: PAS domain S-box protein, partial [Roseimicrobium sp.]|nr:PAS domain S-box protein [Roseimicrobium sp.]
MKKTGKTSDTAAAAEELRVFASSAKQHPMMSELHRRAEVQLKAKRKLSAGEKESHSSPQDYARDLHELQVHQIELELQNAELQRTRNELENLLEEYTDLYDFAPVGYFTLDAQGRIKLVNLTGARLLGVDRSQLGNRPFSLHVAQGHQSAFRTFLKQVFLGRGRETCEVGLAREGKKPCSVSIEAQRSPGGGECRAVVVDTSDRKRVEDAVRVSETRYRRLFETAHDGVLLLDPVTSKITDANPFMTKLLGYSTAQLIGKELYEIGLLKDGSASQEMFRKLKRQHEVRYEDLPLESKGGRHQEVEVVANLYRENGHEVIQCN